ncbi:unnamed protein product [Vitrella brassicaformis CCMP3155]|uniref:Uncharacterized protein n=1 Tax=Vitrella brassicaformis (strain CCMP3155) TaxID=1169540 RepID=A0A0G4EME0_VITBC|nr:unnamed protein product [Vitrella brassicaformis CCMP3155]|eukprot:CEL98334.1 unnamed protein product [Vitrella brassicaformis CCMP3155]
MNGGVPLSRPHFLHRVHEQWRFIKLDRHRSQSLADPINMTTPEEHRQVWLTKESTQLIMGQPGWQLTLLPAKIDEDARPRPLRHLYRLQDFRKPAMDIDEQATDYDSQCGVRVYWGGELVDEVRYVPVKKSKDDKLCATCVVPGADGNGNVGICGKQNTYRNVVNTHLRKTHKLTNEDAQLLLVGPQSLAPSTAATHTPVTPFVFAGSVIHPSGSGADTPSLGVLPFDAILTDLQAPMAAAAEDSSVTREIGQTDTLTREETDPWADGWVNSVIGAHMGH